MVAASQEFNDIFGNPTKQTYVAVKDSNIAEMEKWLPHLRYMEKLLTTDWRDRKHLPQTAFAFTTSNHYQRRPQQ